MDTRVREAANAAEKDRARILTGMPVAERRLDLAGIDTPVLEGGDGPPMVLLHEPTAHGAKWFEVIPDLVTTHRVVAPDLPGHGSSDVGDGPLDAERVVAWLGELIERTCAEPPVLVGLILGGAIAARFATSHSDRLEALVLVDSLGLAPFSPAPEFGRALEAYMARPTEESHDRFWSYCLFDLERVRERIGTRWEPLTAYDVRGLDSPSVQASVQVLMQHFGMPPIAPEDLERIAVPTTLIWGRHDLATRLEVAEAASARYGWPLHVIENCADDPPIEQPEAFLQALRLALEGT